MSGTFREVSVMGVSYEFWKVATISVFATTKDNSKWKRSALFKAHHLGQLPYRTCFRRCWLTLSIRFPALPSSTVLPPTSPELPFLRPVRNPAVFLLDLSEAFYTVGHFLLLEKVLWVSGNFLHFWLHLMGPYGSSFLLNIIGAGILSSALLSCHSV